MQRRTVRAMVTAIMALAVMVGVGGPVPVEAVSGCTKPPALDASNFGVPVDNAYFPLRPGTTYRFKGKEDGERAEDVFAVQYSTKLILGVTTTVVHDQGFVKGKLAEDTLDWFAQDKAGVVWYFGEDTRQLENGVVVSTEGSWEAGVNGARAGIFMPAAPKVGQIFQQEHAKGVAEDCFQIVDVNASVKVPYTTSNHALETREFTRLEPGVFDSKWYAPGVGEVRSAAVPPGGDFLELVSVTTA